MSLFAPRTAHRLACSLLPSLLMMLTAATLAEAQGQSLRLSDGFNEITELEVGGDLFVEIPMLVPNVPLILRLVDEFGRSAATEHIDVPADISGPIPLWIRSGIVGCDDLDAISPATYRFRDFPQATAALVNRTFTVDLRQADDNTGTPIASASLPLRPIVPGRGGFLFFSDATGCPRSDFEDTEDVYQSGYITDIQNGVSLFLVDPDEPTSASQQILEVRPQFQHFPQSVTGIGQGIWTHLLWSGNATIPGDYGAIIGTAKDRGGFQLLPDDRGVGTLDEPHTATRTVHGMTIQEEDCPECDPFWDPF